MAKTTSAANRNGPICEKSGCISPILLHTNEPSPMNMATSADPARGELTRGVGPWAATAVNVANMIGTGVFLKTRVMTCNVGGAKTVLLVWAAAGLLSLAGTFSYSEIAAMMPEAGGFSLWLDGIHGGAGRIPGCLGGRSCDLHECGPGRRVGSLACGRGLFR